MLLTSELHIKISIMAALPARPIAPPGSISKPNKVHKAGLLFLPHDKVRRCTYNYTLIDTDVALRFKKAELYQ